MSMYISTDAGSTEQEYSTCRNASTTAFAPCTASERASPVTPPLLSAEVVAVAASAEGTEEEEEEEEEEEGRTESTAASMRARASVSDKKPSAL